jgi:hypothetical protein
MNHSDTLGYDTVRLIYTRSVLIPSQPLVLTFLSALLPFFRFVLTSGAASTATVSSFLRTTFGAAFPAVIEAPVSAIASGAPPFLFAVVLEAFDEAFAAPFWRLLASSDQMARSTSEGVHGSPVDFFPSSCRTKTSVKKGRRFGAAKSLSFSRRRRKNLFPYSSSSTVQPNSAMLLKVFSRRSAAVRDCCFQSDPWLTWLPSCSNWHCPFDEEFL